MINAGEFNRRITIVRRTDTTDTAGFKTPVEVVVCKAWAKIKTTAGYQLVTQGTDFEDATTAFKIRMPRVEIKKTDVVKYKDREWQIRYFNDIDEAGKFLELQVEAVTQNG